MGHAEFRQIGLLINTEVITQHFAQESLDCYKYCDEMIEAVVGVIISTHNNHMDNPGFSSLIFYPQPDGCVVTTLLHRSVQRHSQQVGYDAWQDVVCTRRRLRRARPGHVLHSAHARG
jgi:uncharacterized protein YejL (UPF0352 family)